MQPKIHKRSDAGFTLIELIVISAIIGIVAAIALPQFKNISRDAKTRAAARELYANFQAAKMEAVKRNVNVGILFTTSGTHNYKTFIDADSDGVLDAGETVISTTKMPQDHVLQNVTYTAANPAGFGPQGRPYRGLGNGTVELNCSTSGKTFRVTTSVAGYVHMVKL